MHESAHIQRERVKSAQPVLQSMKCPNCGGTSFDQGTMALYNSISYLVFNSEKRKFVTLGNSLNARVCLKCGRVELFAPAKALKKNKGIRQRCAGSRAAGEQNEDERSSSRP
jgi:predicted nucleic-acid-binding Zn-ribbon protein